MRDPDVQRCHITTMLRPCWRHPWLLWSCSRCRISTAECFLPGALGWAVIFKSPGKPSWSVGISSSRTRLGPGFVSGPACKLASAALDSSSSDSIKGTCSRIHYNRRLWRSTSLFGSRCPCDSRMNSLMRSPRLVIDLYDFFLFFINACLGEG